MNYNNNLYLYITIMIKINKAFYNKLLLNYNIDLYWKRIKDIVDLNVKYFINNKNVEFLFIYIIFFDLIFYKNKFIDLE